MSQKTAEAAAPANRTLGLGLSVYALLFLLGLWGCLAIYNSTVHTSVPFKFVGRQCAWLLVGMAVLFLSSRIPFRFYRKNALWLAILAFIPMLAVLQWGVTINGMRGWFSCEWFFIQPSELAKPFFLLGLCVLAIRLKNPLACFALLAGISIVWMLPLAAQPDLGMICLYGAGFAIVYWLSGGKSALLLGSALASLPLAIFLALQHKYVLGRLAAFLNPAADPLGYGWHIRQFQYTMARGGFSGSGWGKAIWSNSYLPLSHTDSVFASLCESVGFLGSFPVIAGFVALAWIAYRLSLRSKGEVAKLFIFSTATLFAVQALLHISVNATMLPATGVTLPLLSYGGSSLVSSMLAFGIMLSAAEENTEE